MFSGMGVEQFPADLKERFDVCTAAGIWLKGHMPGDAMDDIIASLKKGGYYATALRTLYYEPGQEEGYRAKFDSLQSEGKLKLVHSKIFKRGIKGIEGIYSETDSILLVFQHRRTGCYHRAATNHQVCFA